MRDKRWWSWSVWLLTLEQQEGGSPSHKSEQSDRRAKPEAGDHLLLGLRRETTACLAIGMCWQGREGWGWGGVHCVLCLQFQPPVSLAVSEDRLRRCLCSPALHVLGGQGFGRGWGSSYILSHAHTLSLSSLQGVNDHLSTEKGQSLLGRRGLVSLPCLQGDQLHTYCVSAGLCSLWGWLLLALHMPSGISMGPQVLSLCPGSACLGMGISLWWDGGR